MRCLIVWTPCWCDIHQRITEGFPTYPVSKQKNFAQLALKRCPHKFFGFYCNRHFDLISEFWSFCYKWTFEKCLIEREGITALFPCQKITQFCSSWERQNAVFFTPEKLCACLFFAVGTLDWDGATGSLWDRVPQRPTTGSSIQLSFSPNTFTEKSLIVTIISRV